MKISNYGKMVIYKIYSVIAYILPMLITYFIFFHKAEPKTQFGFWFYIILFLCLIVGKNIIFERVKKNLIITAGVFMLVIGIFFSYMGEALTIIGVAGCISALTCTVFIKVADVYHAHAFISVNGNTQVLQRNPEPAIPEKDAWKIAYGVYNG